MYRQLLAAVDVRQTICRFGVCAKCSLSKCGMFAISQACHLSVNSNKNCWVGLLDLLPRSSSLYFRSLALLVSQVSESSSCHHGRDPSIKCNSGCLSCYHQDVFSSSCLFSHCYIRLFKISRTLSSSTRHVLM